MGGKIVQAFHGLQFDPLNESCDKLMKCFVTRRDVSIAAWLRHFTHRHPIKLEPGWVDAITIFRKIPSATLYKPYRLVLVRSWWTCCATFIPFSHINELLRLESTQTRRSGLKWTRAERTIRKLVFYNQLGQHT